MGMYLITGVPGSGKSYYAVWLLVKKFYEKLKGSDQYVIKDSELTIITNIENLKLPHISLDSILEKTGMTAEKFFSYEYQKTIRKKYPKIVYFIDEAQNYFDTYFKDKDVFLYFQKHRHFGDDVYLITQDQRTISKGLVALTEYEVRAVARTLNPIQSRLNYNKKSNGKIFGKENLRKDKKIFALYKSMDEEETVKIKNPLVKFIVIPLLMVPICLYFFITHFQNKFKMGNGKQIKEVSMKGKKLFTAEEVEKYYNDNNAKIKEKLKAEIEFEVKKRKVVLSHIEMNKKILVVDPITGELMPIRNFPYKTQIVKVMSLTVYAYIPETEFNENAKGKNEDKINTESSLFVQK